MAVSLEIKGQLSVILAAVVFIIMLSILVFGPEVTSIADLHKTPDQCLTCHNDQTDMSVSHPMKNFGCAVCHLGNSIAADEKNAHAGMVRNPSDLFWIDKTCGTEKCHPEQANMVKNSIMSSNAGLAAATLYQWFEKSGDSDSLIHIQNNLPDTSLASSHIRKLCAGCHINKKENDFPGEIGTRGGGCNDCHLVNSDKNHPSLTVEIGIDACEKCHNRSNRTALNYQGKFESEGYGTPFEQGNFSSDTLSGGRFFYHLPADVHFEAGMVCIDCHTAEEVMGDGKRHEHLEDHIQINCRGCHQPEFSKPDSTSLVWKRFAVNQFLHLPEDSLAAKTSRGSYWSNVFREKEKLILVGKTTGERYRIPKFENKADCNLPGHKRLACQVCHTAYMPQCYGCHDVYDPAGKQLDKITYKETSGAWKEYRSYLRFERPALGVDQFNRIMPVAPGCQVYLTELDDSGEIRQKKFWPTMAAFDPHVTRTKTAACVECHIDPKRLGLGEGRLALEDSEMNFQEIYDSKSAGLGDFPLEQLIDKNGQQKQRMSRTGEKPFNEDEINRIYRAGYCIICHEKADDKIYKHFSRSLAVFNRNSNLPCRKEN